MKKWFSLALAMLLALSCALAEFDFDALKNLDDMVVYTLPGTADTVVRPMVVPYQGTLGEDEMIAQLDYIILPDQEVATLRLCLSLSLFDPLQADSVTVTVGGVCYTFPVEPEVTEYDGIYMEDYALILTSESMPLLTALSGKKSDGCLKVTFCREDEEIVREGEVVLSREDVKAMLTQFDELGGGKQDLSVLVEKYPCETKKEGKK